MSRFTGIFIFESMENNRTEPPEIRIRGVGQALRDQLNNISDNTGVPLSGLLKPKLIEFVNSYSAEMKLPKKKD